MSIATRTKPGVDPGLPGKVPLSEYELGAPVTAALAWNHGFVFAAGDGVLTFVATDFASTRTVQVHNGAILCAVVDELNDRILSGGDDGRVCCTDHSLGVVEIARSEKRWIEHIAVSLTGATAWSSGKRLTLQSSCGRPHCLELSGSIGGLAFSNKSEHLAAAHSSGVSVYDGAHLGDPPVARLLEWRGGYIGVSWSPDDRFIVAPMWDGAARGWRVRDGEGFSMDGYPSPPRSLSWSTKGNWLVTSGAQHAVLWSLRGKNALNNSCEGRAWRPALISAVAFVSNDGFFALGYSDGAILLARLDDMQVILVRPASRNAIVGLAWSPDGLHLAYGQEDGRVGIADFTPFSEPKGT